MNFKKMIEFFKMNQKGNAGKIMGYVMAAVMIGATASLLFGGVNSTSLTVAAGTPTWVSTLLTLSIAFGLIKIFITK